MNNSNLSTPSIKAQFDQALNAFQKGMHLAPHGFANQSVDHVLSDNLGFSSGHHGSVSSVPNIPNVPNVPNIQNLAAHANANNVRFQNLQDQVNVPTYGTPASSSGGVSPPPANKSPGFLAKNWKIIILVLVGLLILGAITYFFLKNKKSKKQQVPQGDDYNVDEGKYRSNNNPNDSLPPVSRGITREEEEDLKKRFKSITEAVQLPRRDTGVPAVGMGHSSFTPQREETKRGGRGLSEQPLASDHRSGFPETTFNPRMSSMSDPQQPQPVHRPSSASSPPSCGTTSGSVCAMPPSSAVAQTEQITSLPSSSQTSQVVQSHLTTHPTAQPTNPSPPANPPISGTVSDPNFTPL